MKSKIFLSYQIDDIEQLLPVFRKTRGLRGTPSVESPNGIREGKKPHQMKIRPSYGPIYIPEYLVCKADKSSILHYCEIS